MSAGSRGLLEDTFFVYLPPWWYHVTADGYSDTQREFLDVLPNKRLAERGTDFATISVPIRVHKVAPDQEGATGPPAK
jgi:hypothetical protein